MEFKLKNFLWELYPFFYDKMDKFPPYSEMIEQAIKALEIKEGRKYLDVGCGTGNMIARLLSSFNNIEVHGFDGSFSALKFASGKLKNYESSSSIYLYQYFFKNKLPFETEYFDGISAINFIQYLDSPSLCNFISEARRILKKGGKLCLVYTITPTHGKAKEEFKKFLRDNPKEAIFSLPFYLIVGILNLSMVLRKNLICYESKYIENLLKEMNFHNIQSKKIYFESSILTFGEKRN